MLAPEPVIRYCPLEALNSADPLIAGPPTSPELVKMPRFPLWAKAEADSRQTSDSRDMVDILRFLNITVWKFLVTASWRPAPAVVLPIHPKTTQCWSPPAYAS